LMIFQSGMNVKIMRSAYGTYRIVLNGPLLTAEHSISKVKQRVLGRLNHGIFKLRHHLIV
jgi:hypothetical protein